MQLTYNALKIGQVEITFQRTLRLPDTDETYPLPPSLGTFPMVKVQDYINDVPEHWAKRKGVIIPMWQKEGMHCITFTCILF